ncbi:MAG: NAD(P)/FAD-dependent oxidoreductase, partial [Chloroflexaceae bacterium]|nr:NAD(P)/FAD-dependent oxidoreductase [Chloroflexaceae bacterium]
MTQIQETPVHSSTATTHTYDAIIVGAGFAGLYMLYRLRQLGLSSRVLEAGDGIGGTWYWNRYPGARCDVESMEYSYSFSQKLQEEWQWSERYAGQPEILRYIHHVADRFELWSDIQLSTRVASATFDEAAGCWAIATEAGEQFTAAYCIMATGCLSVARVPSFEGLDSFEGNTYHTGNWPHEGVDFTGQRVAVIGTGSSGIQSIPVIAEQAAHLYVFQRTPNFSIPARNMPLTPEYQQQVKANYDQIRWTARNSAFGVCFDPNDQAALETTHEAHEREYRRRWEKGGLSFLVAFNDLLLSKEANETAAEFVRARIRETVRNPSIAETLMPFDHPIGTKRICADTNYYETFNREHVTLIDVRATPIAATHRRLRTTETEFEVDSIVFATGFDAMTGALMNIDIRGRAGSR